MRNIFLGEKYAENVHQKLVPDPFLILVSSPKQLMYAETLLKIRYFERRLSKKPLKVNLLFTLHAVHFYGQDFEKQKGSENIYQSLIRLESMFRKIPFLVIYHLGNFDDLIQIGF